MVSESFRHPVVTGGWFGHPFVSSGSGDILWLVGPSFGSGAVVSVGLLGHPVVSGSLFGHPLVSEALLVHPLVSGAVCTFWG